MDKSSGILNAVLGGIAGAPGAHGGVKPRMGVAGAGPRAEAAARAYSQHVPGGRVALYTPGGADGGAFGEFLAAVDAVEVCMPPGKGSALALELLKAGKHVSLPPPFAASVAEAEALMAAAEKKRVFVRLNDPALFFDPYMRLVQMIEDMEIGEVCAVRISAVLCGSGGWGPDAARLKGGFFAHPAFDNYALAVALGGEVEAVSVYGSGFSARRGGRAVVGFKYKWPGRYGCMELTYAPGIAIRSECDPVADTVEIAGTDGIIWARHFRGKLTEEPWLEVRRGKKHYTLGIGSGMKLGWSDAMSASVEHFMKCVERGKQPSPKPAEAMAAAKFMLAVREASVTGAEVKI